MNDIPEPKRIQAVDKKECLWRGSRVVKLYPKNLTERAHKSRRNWQRMVTGVDTYRKFAIKIWTLLISKSPIIQKYYQMQMWSLMIQVCDDLKVNSNDSTWSLMIQNYLIIPKCLKIQGQIQMEVWTLIIQKTSVTHPSEMVLFFYKNQNLVLNNFLEISVLFAPHRHHITSSSS